MICVIVALAAFDALLATGNQSQPSSTRDRYAGYVANGPWTVVSNSSLGLSLMLLVQPGHLYSGLDLDVGMSVYNTLPASNNLSTSHAVAPLPVGCNSFPGYLAISSGHYTAENVSRAVPLDMGFPGIYNCGAAYHIDRLVFAPASDLASALVKYSPPNTCVPVRLFCNSENLTMSSTLESNGYWTGSEMSGDAAFHVFSPGIYTVYAEDPWGQVAFSYFEVYQGGALVG